jgi:hypothetical protein
VELVRGVKGEKHSVNLNEPAHHVKHKALPRDAVLMKEKLPHSNPNK